jgi:hypothetical protein
MDEGIIRRPQVFNSRMEWMEWVEGVDPNPKSL